jgi:hypothetical protein
VPTVAKTAIQPANDANSTADGWRPSTGRHPWCQFAAWYASMTDLGMRPRSLTL